jgi:hypothetical protein
MNAFSHKLILTLAAIFCLADAFAQTDASVKALVTQSKILVGDQLSYTIEAKHDPGASRLQWASIPDTFNSLEVVERGKIDTNKQGASVIYKQTLLITGFDSGVYVIPSFVFPVVPNSGTAYSLQTEALPVLVQTVAVDTTKPFRDIKDIIPVETSWRDHLWLIIAAIVLLVLVIMLIIYLKKRKARPKPPPPPPPVEPLHVQALRMLSTLEQKQLWQNGQVKQYYIELTDILRSYIEARFNTATLELTTDELLDNIKDHSELQHHVPMLSALLRDADLVKFAKAQPAAPQHTRAMEQSVQFVNATKQTEQPKQP